MENVVPAILQRLRAADIIRMAGLENASLGQEYSRTGTIHNTQLQDARLSGIVEVAQPETSLTLAIERNGDTVTQTDQHHYSVEVEIQNLTSWVSTCQCNHNPSLLCPHASALLYQWLARPTVFVTTAGTRPTHRHEPSSATDTLLPKSLHLLETPTPTYLRGPSLLGDLQGVLTQMPLSELRGIAREYEMATSGLTKQLLAEAILDLLKQPEAVRRVATTLEKPQRQLLAAITLAGGSITDDDLRGLFERFSLGQPNQLQRILTALQSKAMLFRTSLNNSSQSHLGLSGTLLDIGWYVPIEVRNALRVSVPVTIVNVEQENPNTDIPLTIQHAEAYGLLAELLLIARALDGYCLQSDDEWHDISPFARATTVQSFVRAPGLLSPDGSVPMPPPVDMSSAPLLSTLQNMVPRSTPFLQFAVRLLHLADLLQKNDNNIPSLRARPKIAALLLDTSHVAFLKELFNLWLAHSSYAELIVLQEDGLRLRCRATPLNLPILRSGELDTENSEARHTIVALLNLVPSNQWISFSAFARFVYRLYPLFLQKRQRLFSVPHWWIEQEEGHPLRPLQLSDWLRAEMYYLAHLLSGPLHWWGVCDIALSHDGRLQAFRLTPLANLLLSDTSSVPDQDTFEQNYHMRTDALEIIDAEKMLITCSLQSWPLIETLETFTEVAGVLHGRLCYRLTPGALGEALSQGLRPTPLLALLRSYAAHSSKQNIILSQMLMQLEQWIASYGRVRIYTGATLLETNDTVVMRELSATTSLDKQIVQHIRPTLLILRKKATERLIDDLKRRGQTPLLHDEDFYGPE